MKRAVLNAAVNIVLAVLVVLIVAAALAPRSHGADDDTTVYHPDGRRTDLEGNEVGIERLHLLSWRCDREHRYLYVRGEVRNTSPAPMESLYVVAEFRQADGTLVKTADALVDYNPIMPGQTSPFEALTTHNPLITKCQVGFREGLLGGPRVGYSSDR